MPESILESTKKLLGIGPGDTAFDTDITIFINSAFSTLHQLGVGPALGFAITDKSDNWETFTLSNPILNSVKSYVYMKVKLAFDPPATSFAIDAVKEQIKEAEWRLMVVADPKPTYLPEGDDL